MDEELPEYYYKLVSLFVDLGTEVLLKVFKSYIPTGLTIKTLLISKSADINKLKRRRVLHDMHLNMIHQMDEAQFDISLLYVLIRSLTNIQEPNNGWGSACPAPSDKSPGVFLNKLKALRNVAVIHRTRAALKKSEFETFWNDTAEALVELAGVVSQPEQAAIRQRIEEAKSQPLLRTGYYANLDYYT